MENYEEIMKKIDAFPEGFESTHESLISLEDEILCKASPEYKTLCDKENDLKSKIDAETLRIYEEFKSIVGEQLCSEIEKNLNQRVRSPLGGWGKAGDYPLTRGGVLLGARLGCRASVRKTIKENKGTIKNPEQLEMLMDIFISKIVLKYRIKLKDER